MANLVYLATSAPTKLAEELTRSGHSVWEALSVPEVLYLCEHQNIEVVLISSEVEDPEIGEVQIRHLTIRMEPEARVTDVLWALSNLFPGPRGAVQ
ncbi:MAG: hypothetical protein M3P27_00905 [Acidobacteriota bacterium]|nr:hypothetical protein [Acidobacteriota bacterium]